MNPGFCQWEEAWILEPLGSTRAITCTSGNGLKEKSIGSDYDYGNTELGRLATAIPAGQRSALVPPTDDNALKAKIKELECELPSPSVSMADYG